MSANDTSISEEERLRAAGWKFSDDGFPYHGWFRPGTWEMPMPIGMAIEILEALHD